MARLVVPPVDAELRRLLLPVLHNKSLLNDSLWRSSIVPLILKHLQEVEKSIRQCSVKNANAPTGNALDSVLSILASISARLNGQFAHAAPFTIQRVAEILLSYSDSGYSLSTVASARKYLAALSCAVSVTSSESSYLRQNSPSASRETTADPNTMHTSSEGDFEVVLPTSTKYVALTWRKSSSSGQSDSIGTPSPKCPRAVPTDDDDAIKSAIGSSSACINRSSDDAADNENMDSSTVIERSSESPTEHETTSISERSNAHLTSITDIRPSLRESPTGEKNHESASATASEESTNTTEPFPTSGSAHSVSCNKSTPANTSGQVEDPGLATAVRNKKSKSRPSTSNSQSPSPQDTSITVDTVQDSEISSKIRFAGEVLDHRQTKRHKKEVPV